MSSPLRIGVLGLGHVGQGLLELLSQRPDGPVRITWAADTAGSLLDPDGLPPSQLLAAKRDGDLRQVRGAPVETAPVLEVYPRARVDVVVNLLPCDYARAEPAATLLRTALEEGVDVVTAEKASLALRFQTLQEAAARGASRLRYSACVGGSVPFIPILERLARVTPIRGITGVLNATTAYLLSTLETQRRTPEDVLAEAARRGILERDPRHDLDGFDLAAKALLLHNTAFAEPLSWHQVERRGITDLLADPARWTPGTRPVAHIEAQSVRLQTPVLPLYSPLRTQGLECAAVIETQDAGDLALRGVGAGSLGTASNVLADVLSLLPTRSGGEARHAVPVLLAPHV